MRTSRTRRAVSLRPAQTYQLSLFVKRDEQRSCGGRWESCEPCGHGMPCPYDQRKHINCPSLARGTSNLVAEGDGDMRTLRTRHAVSLRPAQTYQLSLFGKRDDQRSCGGRWESCEPCGHGMPCPYDQRGICHSMAKNLSLRVIRYFTLLRCVQYDSLRAGMLS